MRGWKPYQQCAVPDEVGIEPSLKQPKTTSEPDITRAVCLSPEEHDQSELENAQREDDVIRHIRQACLDGEKEAPDRSLAEWELLRENWLKVETKGGLVGMQTKLGFRALVPKSLQSSILKLAHDHPTSGHLGRSRTTERVR